MIRNGLHSSGLASIGILRGFATPAPALGFDTSALQSIVLSPKQLSHIVATVHVRAVPTKQDHGVLAAWPGHLWVRYASALLAEGGVGTAAYRRAVVRGKEYSGEDSELWSSPSLCAFTRKSATMLRAGGAGGAVLEGLPGYNGLLPAFVVAWIQIDARGIRGRR
jgi:hypothetical protein